jgi:hypothetical protein
MSTIYYGNRVRETSTTNGSGNIILSGAPVGYKTFATTFGAKKITYQIYRQDTNFEWEIGVGYVSSSGGVDQLIRERVVSSSNSNNLVSFTNGTKFVESIIAENSVNSSFVNLEEKSSSFTADYASVTYVIDSSSGNINVSLPEVATQNDPIILTFILNGTPGSVYEQIDAITLTPYGTETINGASSETISILNDTLQLVSLPSVNGWVKIDPIQDSTNPYGNDGYVQFKSDGSFSGVAELFWNDASKALYIGNSGTPDINLPSSSGQTTVFNQRLYDNDFRVAGTGNTHVLFVDGGANTVGINTSAPQDMLTINAGNKNGISVYKSGSGPILTIGNTSVSGLVTNGIIGTIVYSGLNSTNSPIQYSKIITEIESSTSGSEKSFVRLGIMNNGSFADVAVFSPSGISLGFDNSNLNGTIIGSASSNEGNNVVLGYYNNVCGENCSVIGDNIVISSGTFGGCIGSNHASSGNNIWVLGGENVSVSGDNRTYLAVNNDNYVGIIGSGYLTFTTETDSDTVFAIKNKSVLTSGADQSIAFIFNNNVGVEKTGTLLISEIDNVNSGLETNTFKIKLINNGTEEEVLSLGNSKIIMGNNSSINDNTVIGYNNTILNSGNNLLGIDILASGTNNNLFGHNIVSSGNNNTIFGKDNTCLSSGNLGIVMIGNGNQADEDYVVSIGTDNANSGLYSFSCGYMNGAHGDYTTAIGLSNIVTSNYSVAVGRNNILQATDLNASLFALGIGNYGSISNTGVIVGYLNTMLGSGSFILGNNCATSGDNNIIIGNNIAYTGNNTIVVSGSNMKVDSLTTIFGGSVGFKQNNPAYTVDVSGSFRVSNTGVGIIYENIPAVTGVSFSGLVIENNIIKSKYVAPDGVNVTGISSTTTLNVLDKKFQFFDVSSTGTYDLILGTGNMIDGREFFIRNISDSPTTKKINIIDGYSSSTLYTIGDTTHTNVCSHAVFDGTRWRLLMVSP